MEVLILAGGLGTRLREVVTDVAKPMAPVNGKPFLEYVLEWVTGYETEKIVISAGYKADTIISHFNNCFNKVPIEYVTEEEPLGTGGAITNALKKLGGNDFIVLNGDTWFPVNLNEFSQFHFDNDSKITVALKMMTDFDRYGTVILEGPDIKGFNEKKYCNKGLINGGIYIINRDFLSSFGMTGKYSFEKEVLERSAGSGSVKGMVFNDQFIDIGIPEDYRRAASVMNFDLL